ncbi:GH32 C-terminal domain-containing protein [Tessaracoccus lapidicaptus]|uniref:GH32 C-terminal domain-containing protein n=1 Tax=Tessaracoccus lapidicaptus TaxID=1427523 RepID=UPI003341C0DB
MKKALGIGLAGAVLLGGLSVPAAAEHSAGQEPYRPAYHWSPEHNWMNDPNGLVYHDGVYHMYYQYNPSGTRWGNMSWGHATSPDLVTWTEQPLAIPQTFGDDGRAVEDIFSGSIVVDETNSSGLGTAENPPLVAMYTSAYTGAHPTLAGIQAQSLAYSLDGGYTWEKYADNPVLNRDSNNFRDPKVIRYTPADGEAYWVMVAVEAINHEVVIYRSDNLVDWTYLSTFGPANATGGIWEVPDLFELPVGDTGETKWVMVVNLNPGSVAGGSGAQYFVGEFDGTEFTAETLVEGMAEAPGTVLEDFEFESWDSSGWTVVNEPGNEAGGPFGPGPVAGTVGGQQAVTGFLGERLVNSFVGWDWPVGTMTSESFTVDSPWLNLLVGGGNHPHVEGGRVDNEPPSGSLLWNGFEGGQTLEQLGWTLSGDFEASRNPSYSGGEYFIGEARINTWEGGPKGDDNVGTLTSDDFVIDADHISFLIGGGRDKGDGLALQLLVGGEPVRSASGTDNGALNWQSWDVSELQGQTAQLRVVDQATGGWAHLTLDHVVMGEEAALPRTDETTVNLVVDGQVVQSATGQNSENLDWVSWDLSPWQGQQAQIRIIDNNRAGWGHILVDQIVASDAPQPRQVERYDWLDWGRDYYAAISFSNTPDGRQVMLAWMNDWSYAENIPTGEWRSAMALPREVTLEVIDGEYELVQAPVEEVATLEVTKDSLRKRNVDVEDGAVALPWSSDAYVLDVTVDPKDAEMAGVAVRTSDDYGPESGEGTFVGVDTQTDKIVVDRTRSGAVDFDPDFPVVTSAPLTNPDGSLTFQVYVDRSSVEVLAEDGVRTLTNQIFPAADSLGLSLVSLGGTARFTSVVATPLTQSVHTGTTSPEVSVENSCSDGASVTLTNPTDERMIITLSSEGEPMEFSLAAGATKVVTLTDGAGEAAGSLAVASVTRPAGAEAWTSISLPACS